MERRDFLRMSIGAGAWTLMHLAGFGCTQKKSAGSKISLPPLPYPPEALEPHISADTVNLHYGKHHQGYVNKIQALIKGTRYEGKGLAHVILGTADNREERNLFNNAAQVFNHTFYWKSMKPLGGGPPPQGSRLARLLDAGFGGFAPFRRDFAAAAAARFGSGWAWLVKGKDRLQIVTTSNAETPVTRGLVPLITVDLWEHAYYLDYQHRRDDYIEAYLNHLVNWEFAESNLV